MASIKLFLKLLLVLIIDLFKLVATVGLVLVAGWEQENEDVDPLIIELVSNYKMEGVWLILYDNKAKCGSVQSLSKLLTVLTARSASPFP